MKKKLFIVLGITATLTACEGLSIQDRNARAQRTINELVYSEDAQTDLCFASSYQGKVITQMSSTDIWSMAQVPCTDKVRDRIALTKRLATQPNP